MTVAHILSSKGGDIVTIAPSQTVAGAVALLNERRIGAVLVCEGDQVHGILSERDVVRGLSQCGAACLDEPVSSLMTADVATCTPHQSITDVMGLMTDRRIRHLPVVDKGRLIGLVSIGDVVKRRIAEAQQEADDLRAYIATG